MARRWRDVRRWHGAHWTRSIPIPLSSHTIHLVEIDPATKTLRTQEHGGLVRVCNHTLRVEPVSARACRYSDTVELDAGTFLH